MMELAKGPWRVEYSRTGFSHLLYDGEGRIIATVEANRRDESTAIRLLPDLVRSLRVIAAIGGNLPDERFTDRTGPNDAAHRGLMYCEAREIATKALERLDEQL